MDKLTEKKLPIGYIVLCALLLLGVLWSAFFTWSLLDSFNINGLLFPFESRLTKDGKNYKMRPGTEFDVEFPDSSAGQANFIAQVRLGKVFYDNAVTFAANQSLVKDAVGKISEIRPAKGENRTYRPFTDGESGGRVTLRVSGDKGVIVVRIWGSGPDCKGSSIEILALKSPINGTETSPATLSLPIRLLGEQTEADYDKHAKNNVQSFWRQAEQLEKEGKIKEAEVAWKRYVAECERDLDDKNIPAIRYQMLAEYNAKKTWFTPCLLSALSDLAYFYQRQKQPEKERETLLQLMPVRETLCPERLSSTADELRRLADSCERRGQLKDATECMAKELALHEKYQNPFRAYVERRKRKYQELMRQLSQVSNAHRQYN
jgi:hypothetical protein